MAKLNERHTQILDLIKPSGFVSVQELSQKLNVSLVTIRKDLSYLEKEGFLYRTHGGASKNSTYAYEKNVIEKEGINTEQKQKISKEGIKLIQNNDFIILSSGTTIHYLARILEDFEKLTVLTSSLSVSIELCQKPNIDVIQLGGEIRKNSTSVIGAISESVLEQFSCNKLFLGVDGIDVNFGISTSNAAEAHLNQKMMESADKIIVLADSSKIGKRGFGRISSLAKIDVLITDNNITNDSLNKFEEIGIEVIIA